MKVYNVYLWSGGYALDEFRTIADSEEEALDIIIAEVVNNGLKGYFYEVDEVDEEELEASGGLLYIDATMEGADRPVYIDAYNTRVEENKRLSNKVDKLLHTEVYGELPDEYALKEVILDNIDNLEEIDKDWLETYFYYDYKDNINGIGRAISFHVPSYTTAEDMMIQRIIRAGNIKDIDVISAIREWFYETGQYIDSEDGKELLEAFKEDYLGTFSNPTEFAIDYIYKNGYPENSEEFFDYDKFAENFLTTSGFNIGRHYFYNR